MKYEKILIVDDSEIMQKLITSVCSSLGYINIDVASSGYEAVKMYKQHRYDFITMDIIMPASNGINSGMDALELILQLNSKAKVIMITSRKDIKLVDDAVNKGAKAYITKPVSKEKMTKAIKEVIWWDRLN